MSLLVVLGAGASYDSDKASPVGSGGDSVHQRIQIEARPPLAAQLFEDAQYGHSAYRQAVDRYPRAAAVISRLRRAPRDGVTIEEALGRLQDERFRYPELHAQLSAVRYYLRDAIRGVEQEWFEGCNHFTNYLDLVDQLARFHHVTGRPVYVVTFNYDTLIERAMADALDAELSSIDAYTSRSDLQLFKPHGSVNWVRSTAIPAQDWQSIDALFPEIEQERAIIELSRLSQVGAEYATTLQVPRVVDRRGGTLVWTPAIAVPTVSKQQFEAPPTHIDQLLRVLPDIEDTLVIGWRGAERHFLRLLRDCLRVNGTLTVVAESFDAADETVRSLWRTQKFGRHARMACGFSGLFSGPGDGSNLLDAALRGQVPTNDHAEPSGQSLDDEDLLA